MDHMLFVLQDNKKRISFLFLGIVSVPVVGTVDPRACNRMSGRVRQGEIQAGEEGNNLMWLLDFKLDFFNDEAKEKGESLFFVNALCLLSPCEQSKYRCLLKSVQKNDTCQCTGSTWCL